MLISTLHIVNSYFWESWKTSWKWFDCISDGEILCNTSKFYIFYIHLFQSSPSPIGLFCLASPHYWCFMPQSIQILHITSLALLLCNYVPVAFVSLFAFSESIFFTSFLSHHTLVFYKVGASLIDQQNSEKSRKVSTLLFTKWFQNIEQLLWT